MTVLKITDPDYRLDAANPLKIHRSAPHLSQQRISCPNVNTASVKKPWTTLLLKVPLAMQRLEAQKLFENYLSEQQCCKELT